MKDKLIQDFMKKLDASYEYKTVNERQNIITELYKIAEYEQLNTPDVSVAVCDHVWRDMHRSGDVCCYKCGVSKYDLPQSEQLQPDEEANRCKRCDCYGCVCDAVDGI